MAGLPAAQAANAQTAVASIAAAAVAPPSDEFDGTALNTDLWSTIVRDNPALYGVRDGALHVTTGVGDLWQGGNNAPNLILQPAPDGTWQATTKVTIDAKAGSEQAALVLYSGDDDYVKLNLIGRDGTRWSEFIIESGGQPRFEGNQDRSPNLPGDFPTTFFLRMTYDNGILAGSISPDGESWTQVGRLADTRGFVNPKIGLFALTNDAGSTTDAAFDWFRIGAAEPIEDTRAPAITIGDPIRPDEGIGVSEDVTVTFAATDELLGSGVQSVTATLDGEPIISGDSLGLPFLSPGQHTLTVTATDKAGNTAEKSVMFEARTSFGDLDTVMMALVEQDRLAGHVATSLRDRLTRAQEAWNAGSESRPIGYLSQFVARAKNQVKGDAQDAQVRDMLVANAQALIAQFEAIDEAEGNGMRRLSDAEIGLQLYTVRDAANRDLEATLAAVAAAGYKNVEPAGLYGRSPQEFKALLGKYGLRAVSSHVGLGGNFEQTVEDAVTMGQEIIGIAGTGASSEADWHQFARDLNAAADIAQAHGLKLFYHNHDYEFRPLPSGVTPMEILLNETDDNVKLQLDVFWALQAGADPVQLLSDHPGKFVALHVKGMKADGSMTDVGEGVVDWAPIFAAAERGGLDWYIVENDEPAGGDSLDSILDSYLNLRLITFPDEQ
jgi:sugar phosphate isomerase/epimerase